MSFKHRRRSKCGHWCWHCAGWLVTGWASERGGGIRGRGGRYRRREESVISSSTGPSVLSSLAWWSGHTAAPPGRGCTHSVRSWTGCSSWRAMSSPVWPGLRSPLLVPPTGQRQKVSTVFFYDLMCIIRARVIIHLNYLKRSHQHAF